MATEMTHLEELPGDLEQQADRLRNRIQAIRIDQPEAADQLRHYLAEVEAQIAEAPRAHSPAATLEAVAWQHTLHMDGGQTAVRLARAEIDRPWGKPAIDYSAEYTVTIEPLYTHPAPAAPQEGAVKPLEWEDQNGERYRADTVVGKYDVIRHGNHFALVGPNDSFDGFGYPFEGPASNCKAAAQADYEKRILSALVPAPSAPTLEAVEGASSEQEAVAIAIWAQLCPGIVMGDEDLSYYEAAAKLAIDYLREPAAPTLEADGLDKPLAILARCKRNASPVHDVHVLTTTEAETIAAAITQLRGELLQLHQRDRVRGALITQLRKRLASVERERDDAVRSISDMAERFRAVNVSEAIKQTIGENVFALRERAEAAEAKVLALREHMQVAINLIVAQKEIRARLRLEIALSPDKPCQTS